MRYDAIWEYGFLEELVGRDKVILQADFNQLLASDQGVSSRRDCCGVGDTRFHYMSGLT